MSNCTFGRPALAAPMNDVENKIVEAVFKLRENFGSLSAAKDRHYSGARNLDADARMLHNFFHCLAAIESENQDIMEEIHTELKSYENDVPE